MLAALVVALLAGCGGTQKHAATDNDGTQKQTVTQQRSGTVAQAAAPHAIVLSKPSYERTMRRLGKALSVSVEGMFPIVDDGAGSQANKAALAKVETARAVVARVGATLALIVPPAPIRADHAKLIVSVKALRKELDALIGALQQSGSHPLGAYTQLDALNAIALATTDIEKKGYAIG
jgi:hypothetical protein